MERVPLKKVAVLLDFMLSSTLKTYFNSYYWISFGEEDDSSSLETEESLSISQASSSSLEEKNDGFPNNVPGG